jgi:DNA-binding CsgD family transcriptional regulator
MWETEGLKHSIGAFVFERLGHGILVLDKRGMVLEGNSAAARIIDKADGLLVRAGRLAARGRHDTERLETTVTDLSLIHGDRARVARRSLLIARRPPARPYAVVLSAQLLRANAFADLCLIVLIVDLDQRSIPEQARLKELFGLTEREASLAIAITEGDGLANAAQRLGIGMATARTHLAAVFSKTGTRRQAELTRLVCNAVAPLCL